MNKDLNLTNLTSLEFKGPYGYLVPPDQILPNALDIFDAMKAVVRTCRGLGYFD